MLDGMRICSFTHWLQGPATTQYLADMGADVIRIEMPGGSYERRIAVDGRLLAGTGSLALAGARNSRSIVLDLKHPDGVAAALRLIESCDAVVENYRPGVMDKLGLGFEAVKARKPDIIYASATGYGPDGPLSKGPGQDLLVQARAGLISVTGEWRKRPTPVGAAVVDQHGAALLAMGILGAYARKLKTGRGSRVEGSLYTACTDLMQEIMVHYYALDLDLSVMERDRHIGSWYLAAPYGTYALKDATIVVSINPIKTVAAALESDRLADMAELDQWDDRDELANALAEELAAHTFADVDERFTRHGIWFEKVQDFDEVRADPQAAYAKIFREVHLDGETAVLVNHPIRYDGEPPEYRCMPLRAGQDTRTILAEVGYTAPEIESMVAAGAVGVAD